MLQDIENQFEKVFIASIQHIDNSLHGTQFHNFRQQIETQYQQSNPVIFLQILVIRRIYRYLKYSYQ